MMIWQLLHPSITPEHLGFIPSFISEEDPRPAAQQIDDNYRHGGGWSPHDGFALRPNCVLRSKYYPEDPDLEPLACTKLRDELIIYYDCAWVAIIQADGSFEVSRLD